MPLVLVIEDDVDSNEATVELLNEEGYSCLSAFDGENGFRLLVEHEPALVLLDLQLPRMTGIELLARKATTPSIAATPVIVITGITPVPKVENVVAILQKPFTSDELLSLVRTFAPMPEPEAA